MGSSAGEGGHNSRAYLPNGSDEEQNNMFDDGVRYISFFSNEFTDHSLKHHIIHWVPIRCDFVLNSAKSTSREWTVPNQGCMGLVTSASNFPIRYGARWSSYLYV